MRDLIVAGGGPVGLATALFAARAGLDVLVREPRRGVIDKACGEGLMPGAMVLLAELGVDPPGRPLRGITYTDGTRTVTAAFRHGPGRGVRRTTLHASLRDAVAAAGIPVEQRAVRSVTSLVDRVLVDDDEARYLVAADGLHSTVRGLVGLDVPARGSRRFGLRTHLEVPPWSEGVEVHWSLMSEAYVTPVSDGLVGIAVLSRVRGSLRDHLDSIPSLAPRLAGVELSAVRGAGPLRQRSRRRVAGRVLLVGDAAGYVDALTGEGIAGGVAQGKAAVAAIAAGRAPSYERTWRMLTWRHDALTHALLAASGAAPLRRRLVPAAAALPRVFDAAVNQLARPA